MTIQLRLTLWYTALLGLTLTLFSLLVYMALSNSLYNQLEAETQSQARDVSDFLMQQIDPPRTYTSLTTVETYEMPVLLRLVELPKLVVLSGAGDVQVFDAHSGEVLKHSNNISGRPKYISDAAKLAIANQQTYDNYVRTKKGMLLYVYSAPFEVQGQQLGIQIVQSAASIEHFLQQVSYYLLIGTSLSLVLAAIGGAYLARRALAPIYSITNTASGITRTGDLSRRLTISNDVSEVGVLATTFNDMLERIQRLFKTQERLIADVSHELRTPLTTIQGNVELLRRMETSLAQKDQADAPIPAAEMDAIFNESLQEVEAEADRMARMISDLLLLAQADSGELQLTYEPVEMDTLLLDVFRQARRIAERAKGAEALQISLGGEDQALVRGDRERLRQLLLNLAENAVKYTPAGGQVTLGLENKDGWVYIYVRDTGIGISQEDQAQIFERFYRTDKARSREMGGSGLGLSIAQWIAQAHHGYIKVESTLQEGSTFTVVLPELANPAGPQ
ncbi:MAG: HAMP domain-containing sensor histidine kinase [Caldilineaceae bacterium]